MMDNSRSTRVANSRKSSANGEITRRSFRCKSCQLIVVSENTFFCDRDNT
jgi:hypothetical protein